MPAISDDLKLPHTLIAKIIDLPFQRLDNLVGPVNGSPEFASLPLPAADAVLFCTPASLFGLDFVAELALLVDWNRLHDQFHTASFACAILSVAVLSEVAPFPITTGKSVLVVEAHGHCFNSDLAAVVIRQGFYFILTLMFLFGVSPTYRARLPQLFCLTAKRTSTADAYQILGENEPLEIFVGVATGKKCHSYYERSRLDGTELPSPGLKLLQMRSRNSGSKKQGIYTRQAMVVIVSLRLDRPGKQKDRAIKWTAQQLATASLENLELSSNHPFHCYNVVLPSRRMTARK